MFVSYIVAGFWVLLPYFFTGGLWGMAFSIILSIIALFILGVVSAKLTKARVVKRVIRMILVGSFAIVIGVAVGILLR